MQFRSIKHVWAHPSPPPNPGEANLTTCCAHSVKRYTWRFPNLYSPMWIYRFIVIVILFIEEILQQLGTVLQLSKWLDNVPTSTGFSAFLSSTSRLVGARRCGMKCSLEKIDPSQVSGLQSCSASRYQIHWRQIHPWGLNVVRLMATRNPAKPLIWYSLSIPLFIGFFPSFIGFYTSQVVVWDFFHQQYQGSLRWDKLSGVVCRLKSEPTLVIRMKYRSLHQWIGESSGFQQQVNHDTIM